jgi:hypothetical protein
MTPGPRRQWSGVEDHRPTHYLEGDYSEYIMPNMTLFRRESSLYADVVGNEDADPAWSSPATFQSGVSIFKPMAWRVADALDAFGRLCQAKPLARCAVGSVA